MYFGTIIGSGVMDKSRCLYGDTRALSDRFGEEAPAGKRLHFGWLCPTGRAHLARLAALVQLRGLPGLLSQPPGPKRSRETARPL